ncbi:MAG: DUF308 domain-containing protein [Clostridia bacterium]|nr:DUF308 domain-containing protein [Clostridia bacterium]
MSTKKNGKNNILSLVIIGLLGLFLIFWPNASMTNACKLAGVALLLVAAAGVYTWLKTKSTKPSELARLAGSAAAAIIGLWILFNTKGFETIIPVILGLVMIVYGAIELYKAFKGGRNPISMALAAGAIVLGLIVAFNPLGATKAAIICAGIALVYTAVTGIMNEMKTGK